MQWDITKKIYVIRQALSVDARRAKDVSALITVGTSEDGHILNHAKYLHRHVSSARFDSNEIKLTGTSTF